MEKTEHKLQQGGESCLWARSDRDSQEEAVHQNGGKKHGGACEC